MADDEREYVEYVAARLPTLHRTAYLLCGDLHRADDIVQVTITALYVHWRSASRADNLDAYVHRMLVHKLIDETRRSWSRVLLLHRMPEPTPPEPDETGFEERDAIVDALGRLGQRQRAVLVLRFLCDMSVEDTAAALRCSTGTPKGR